ncbi:mitochondrial inner membrane protein Mpv17-like isoform X1 [Rhinoraja longicauda]
MLQGLKLVWRTYQQLLTKHPWKVQILTAGCTCGLSDIISQQLVERRGLSDHNIKRTIKMTTVGLIYVGPILCKWYRYLDQLIVEKTKTAIFKKMLLDQFALAPCFLAGFMVVTGVLGGLSREKIYLKFEQNYKTTMMSNYCIWPAAQLLNFYFISLQNRLAVVQIVALMWNTYLSWMANRP